jgi:type IV secretory pathway TrbD component
MRANPPSAAVDPKTALDSVAIDGSTPAERMEGAARWVVILGTLAGLVLVVHQLFNLQAFGIVLIDGRYLYLLGGFFWR